MKSPLTVSIGPIAAAVGSPVALSLKVANGSGRVLDSVSLAIRIPAGAVCLRGELRMEVARMLPGAAFDIPLVVEFATEGDHEFRVQAGGRAFDGTFRVLETAGIRVLGSAGAAAPGDARLQCESSLRREEAECRVEVVLTGPAGSVVDVVRVGDRPLGLGNRVPGGVPMRFEFRVAVPAEDAVVRLSIGHRDPTGVRRENIHTVSVPGAGRRGLLFVAANPRCEGGRRDLGGLKEEPLGSDGGESHWLQSDVEFEVVSRAADGSPLVHLATPCLAASYQGLLRHLLRVRPRWVHFAGHGKERHLVLHGGDEAPLPVPAEAIQDALQTLGRPLDLLVLNACYSASVATQLKRMARILIATRGPVGDRAAIEFARAFYTVLLAEPVPDPDAIHRAFRAGQGALRAIGQDPEVYELLG
jgi:hypothetical protein